MSVFQSIRLLLAITVVSLCMQASADEVNLSAIKDNTIYSEGNLSNGAGDYIFSGATQSGNLRRALLKFDITAAVPAEATIDAVELSLNVSKAPDTKMQNFSLFRVIADWGEGSSNAPGEEGTGDAASSGDATWEHTFFSNSLWASSGGDFVVQASNTISIGGEGATTWPSTAALVADVQRWLDQPDTNFGWLLKGDETAGGTARRFDSRENPAANLRPQLHILFTPAPTGACCSPVGDCTDVTASVCQSDGGFFKSEGSSCALIQSCPLFQNSFEN